MEEYVKQLPVNSNGQLYHILKTDTFTFCLICLEDFESISDGVGEHLTSTNHTESIKRMFKACNPSLLDEVENERYADIVSKSVFDVSALLGKETCYVSKKEGCWFCLMCEISIIESNDSDANIKDYITNHILSDSHVKNVKGVRFLYVLNVNQDFLLLNKSVVYCFICKDVHQCEELDLLKTAVVHLEIKHPNYSKSHNFQLEPSDFVKDQESKVTEQGFVDPRILGDYLNTLNISGTMAAGEEITPRNCELSRLVKDEHFEKHEGIKAENLIGVSEDIFVENIAPNHNDVKKSFKKMPLSIETSICICLLCKKLLTPVVSDQSFIITLSSHFQKKHPNFYLRTPLRHLIDWVTFHNDPDKINLISKVKIVKKCHRKIINLSSSDVRKHLNRMCQTKTDLICIICMVSISSCFVDNDVLFKHILNHFHSVSHNLCEEEKMTVKQAFKIDKKSKTIVKLSVQKEILKEDKKRRKAERKEKRARQQYLVYQNKMGLSKVEVEKPKIENREPSVKTTTTNYAASLDAPLRFNILCVAFPPAFWHLYTSSI